MSVRRSRKRKREESDEVLDTTVEVKNDETVTPATPEPNGEGTFAETEEKEMQDKDQLVWEAFREEYIESVEQLPLTLHRQFTLMRELDTLAMSSQSKLVPALLEYIAKRQEIERARLQRQRVTPDASHHTVSHSSERGETVPRREGAVQQDNDDLTRSNGLTNGARNANGTTASRSTPSRRGSEVPSLAPPPSGRARSSSSAVSVSTLEMSARALESSVSPLSRTRHTHETLAYISELIGELMRTSEEKLNLAQAAYDSVDRHVRLLDQAIREQEARVPPELRPRSSFSIIAPIQQSPGGSSYLNSILNVGSGLDALVAAAQRGAEVELLPEAAEKSSSRSHRKGHRRKVSESARQKAGEASGVASGDPNIPTSAGALASLPDVPGGVPEFVLTDMPIDPHEPRYCYCNQVSWGEMIGCDNSNCEKEWFHLGCVGLAEAPKGRWFCDDCKDKKERPGGSSTRRRGH